MVGARRNGCSVLLGNLPTRVALTAIVRPAEHQYFNILSSAFTRGDFLVTFLTLSFTTGLTMVLEPFRRSIDKDDNHSSLSSKFQIHWTHQLSVSLSSRMLN